MSNPTIIFCPGAWYPPTAFDTIISKLPKYTCHTCAFPSIQKASETKSLDPDISALRSLVENETDAGRDVLVVSHSWSGLPVSSALDGLSKIEREKEGKKGGVLRIAFISAFLPTLGQSLIGAFGGTPPDWYIHNTESETLTVADPVGRFFHDVPDGEEWASKLRPHSWLTKLSPATGTAYVTIPCSYLLCEDDQAIPFEVQKGMVEQARGLGADIETESIKTSHTPWLVLPDETLNFIRRQAGEKI
ncbi:alpha/beta-hydrolase [Penicillium angulare]|uniref:alpha/beta-hydrolase n=1 Tax=Penicillium angulare TaxID=116970 RepID=UPI002540F01F|nr:alpha/beta-hydrolase [Penicillium angulare]KAJ5280843.1 alpha/beta-hydrolase [Penicillium angulare]